MTHSVSPNTVFPEPIGLVSQSLTLRDGAKLQFCDPEDNLTMDVWGSTWTGREVVRVNGKVVSESRNFSIQTSHFFEVSEQIYEAIITAHPGRGAISVLVLRGRHLLFRGETGRPTDKTSKWKFLGVCVALGIAGMIVGYSVAKLVGG